MARLVSLLLALGLVGCFNEPTPPRDPALSRVRPPDAELHLPEPYSDHAIHKVRAVAAMDSLAIVAIVPRSKGVTQVLLLCDPRLQNVKELARTERSVSDVAVSTDGRYVAMRLWNWGTGEEVQPVSLIDLKEPNLTRSLTPAVPWGLGFAFSQIGHVLAASSLHDVSLTQLWDLDEDRSCALSGRGMYKLTFFDSAGLILSAGGNAIDLPSWGMSGCPHYSPQILPRWDQLAVSDRRKVGYGATDGHGMFLGTGYQPAKLIAFNVLDGTVIRKWVLPYPESEQRVEKMTVIQDDTLMVSQSSRIVLHDASTMRIKDVLGADVLGLNESVYLRTQDAVYAGAGGGTILRWDLNTGK